MKTTLSKSGFSATIDHHGAELVSLQNDAGHEYIWEGDPVFWGKHSPVLFPIVGTLKDNTYKYQDRAYSLPRHGFAREREFTLLNRTDHEATFSLRADDQTRSVYPFDFELQLIYSLSESGLTIGYRVFNFTESIMPFCLGAHPAFALPGNFEDYSLVFEKSEMPVYHLLENDLISDHTHVLSLRDRTLKLNDGLFKNDALVFKKLQSASLTIAKNDRPVLTIDFTGFPNLGLWTKPGAPFLCIEPWFGYADTVTASGNLIQKEAINLLEPRGNFETNFRIMMR